MLFTLKKIVSRFFYPLPFSIILLLIALFLLWRKKESLWGRIIASVAVGILLISSYWPVTKGLAESLECGFQPLEPKINAFMPASEKLNLPKKILVLNGGAYYQHGYPASSQLSSSTILRVIEAVRLHKAIPGSKIYMSAAQGDHWQYIGEVMRDLAWELGVEPDNLISLATGFDTEGEALYIKEHWGKEPFILISSAAHMPRAVATFNKQGLVFIPAPVGYHTMNRGEFTLDYIFPSEKALGIFTLIWHEYLGLIWGNLTGMI